MRHSLDYRCSHPLCDDAGVIAGGEPGHRDGPLSQAQFFLPSGILCDRDGVIYVADTGNHCLRAIVDS